MNIVKEVADAKVRTGTPVTNKGGRPRSNQPKARAVLGEQLIKEAEELAGELEAELGFRPTLAQALTRAVRGYRESRHVHVVGTP